MGRSLTRDERDRLKQLVDRARRARIEHKNLCRYCEVEFAPAKRAAGRQKFCCALHRKAWWQRETDRGRALQAAYKRRRRARLRKQLQMEQTA